jgi:small subunit ribosomal protein S16
MAIKIRLRQQGRNNRPFYRLVAADARSPRDGKYIEALGWYNPFEAEAEKNFFMKADRVQHWLNVGAQLTESVKSLIEKTAPSITLAETKKVLAHRAKVARKRRASKKAKA